MFSFIIYMIFIVLTVNLKDHIISLFTGVIAFFSLVNSIIAFVNFYKTHNLSLKPFLDLFKLGSTENNILNQNFYYKNRKVSNKLNRYKKNFYFLNEKEKDEYKKLLLAELTSLSILANIINTTTDIREFTLSFENLINKLEILTEHEYTGWFFNSIPTEDLNRTLKNKHLTEINFIERKWRRDNPNFFISEEDKKYLSSFSKQAINHIELTWNSAQLKHRAKVNSKKQLSDYELELFAKQCNYYLEHEDKKELWNSDEK